MFVAIVSVMPLKNLLDPQGKAVQGGLHNLNLAAVSDVRVGKKIELKINAATAEEAKTIATQAADNLLCNKVMEYFEVEILPQA
jgi:phosphoribosylformylglycinamidine synthase subunit PurS